VRVVGPTHLRRKRGYMRSPVRGGRSSHLQAVRWSASESGSWHWIGWTS